MKFNYNDGGRSKYFKGATGDCVCRAIAIATNKDYKEIYEMINEYAKKEKVGKRKRRISSARTGVYRDTIKKVLNELGWKWVPVMKIGSGCQAHLRDNEIPMDKTIIVKVTRHLTCVVNGVINDTYDCSRDGNRCVYGYWYKED